MPPIIRGVPYFGCFFLEWHQSPVISCTFFWASFVFVRLFKGSHLSFVRAGSSDRIINIASSHPTELSKQFSSLIVLNSYIIVPYLTYWIGGIDRVCNLSKPISVTISWARLFLKEMPPSSHWSWGIYNALDRLPVLRTTSKPIPN